MCPACSSDAQGQQPQGPGAPCLLLQRSTPVCLPTSLAPHLRGLWCHRYRLMHPRPAAAALHLLPLPPPPPLPAGRCPCPHPAALPVTRHSMRW